MTTKSALPEKPIYLTIREDLLRHYRQTGELRLPSEREMCRKYSVCRPTIHKALSYLREHDLIVRQPGKGTFFRPQIDSSSASKPRVSSVTLVIRKDWQVWTDDFYFGLIVQGICSVLETDNIALTIKQFSDDMLMSLGTDTNKNPTIWLSPESAELEAIKSLAYQQCPVVVLNRSVNIPGVSYVSGDHVSDGEAVGLYLQSKQARRVLFVAGDLAQQLTLARECGLRRSLGDNVSYQLAMVEKQNCQDELVASWRKLTHESGGDCSRNINADIDVNTFIVVNNRALLEPALQVFKRPDQVVLFADSSEALRFGVTIVLVPVAELGRLAGLSACGLDSQSGTLLKGRIIQG